MRAIANIIVHCAATPPDMDIGVAEIREWHLAREWRDIGYHYVIRRNGSVEEGREVKYAGAHAQGHNEDSIGVCLVGGIRKDGTSEFNFTMGQLMALQSLVINLRVKHGAVIKVIGHNEVSSKDCPCFNVGELLGALE